MQIFKVVYPHIKIASLQEADTEKMYLNIKVN